MYLELIKSLSICMLYKVDIRVRSRLPGGAVSRRGAGVITGIGSTVRAEIDACHGRRGRPGCCPRLPLHILRDAVPPAVLQLWYTALSLCSTLGNGICNNLTPFHILIELFISI